MVRMQNRTLLFAAAALSSACLVPLSAGCGSSSSSGPGVDSGSPQDSGTSADTGATPQDSSAPSETGAADTGTTMMHDGGTEAGAMLDCTGGVAPQGTKLLTSTTQTVQGVTSDNQVILYDTSAKALGAIPVTGGTATMIDAYDSSGMGVVGKVLYYYHGGSTATPAIDALSIWTAAGGKQTLATAAYQLGGTIAVNTASTFIAYTTNATATHADIYVAGTDGSSPTPLVMGAEVDTYCQPDFAFVGDYLVVASCTGGDGGQDQATITAYSGTGWATHTPLATSAFYGFSANKAGTMIAYASASGQYVIPVTGGTATLIDPLGAGGASFSPDGSTLYYLQCSTAALCGQGLANLFRSPVTTPAPAQIATPFFGNYGVSPDGNWIEAFKSYDAAQQFTDLYIVSTAAASTPVTLVGTTTAAFFSDQWTADGTQALYFGNVTLEKNPNNGPASGYVGDFGHAKLTAPITPTTIAHDVWQGNATSAAKVLYNDNYVPEGPLYGYADIEALDLSTTAAATKLVTAADANYYLTTDKSTILYSFSACPNLGTPGVYALPAP